MQNHLAWVEHGLLHGDPYMDTPNSAVKYTEQATLFLDDGCQLEYLPYRYTDASTWSADCKTTYDGIMGYGIHATLQVRTR